MMNSYKPPRPLSIAVTNQQQYLMGHRRGWDDAQKCIAELENVISEMFVKTNWHKENIRQLYENSVSASILQAKQLKENENE